MIISEPRIEEFKEIYKGFYGVELSDKEAREKASMLLEFAMLSVPMPEAPHDGLEIPAKRDNSYLSRQEIF